jgi:hypothetical protein
MRFPDFFERIPRITLRDPLAGFLGAAEEGLIEYAYADAVRLAGHSCPTVAGAWLMTVRALRRLYPDEIPERGAVEVAFRENLQSGTAGVIASVVTLLTGAVGDGGFKGLGGRFVRSGLLRFGVVGVSGVRFARKGGREAVDCVLDLSSIPADPRLGRMLPGLLRGDASQEDAELFAALWQERVRRILIEHHDDPNLVVMRP